ncbi:MAG: MtaA/CmuA family methyltransferase [Pseudomonadota bacterium]
MKSQGDVSANNPVLRIFKGERTEGPVCSSPLVTVTLEQMEASASYYPTAHNDPQSMARLSSFAFTSIGFQGIRIPFDLCVEAEAFGCKLRNGGKDAPPSVTKEAFEEKDAFMVPEDIFQKGRFQVVFEAIRILKDKFGDDVTIYTGIVGPLTLIGALYDATTVMRWAIKDPQRMDDNLERAAGFLSEYADRLFDAGGDVLSILDPTASGDLLSRKYFEKYVMPAYQRMREKIQGPISLHICGNTEGFLALLPETGFEAFSFEGPKVSVQTARQKMGDSMLLVGNIPTYDTLLFGTPERVREESLNALGDGLDLLAPACGVPIQTPTENLKAMVRAVEEFKGDRAVV